MVCAVVNPQVTPSRASSATNVWLPTTNAGTLLHGTRVPKSSQRAVGGVPVPSSPQLSHPQQYASFAVVIPHVCQRPAVIEVNVSPPETSVGAVKGPLPVAPLPF